MAVSAASRSYIHGFADTKVGDLIDDVQLQLRRQASLSTCEVLAQVI
jgi:hypothetical protein